MRSNILQIQASAVKAVSDHFSSNPEGCFRLLEKEEIPDQGAKPPNVIGWETKISHGERWVDIIIALTSHFPYRLPRIYLASPAPHPIPHLTPGRDNHICTFERHSTFIDISSPVELVFETIVKAAAIITDGFDQINVGEFDLEFQSYWLLGKVKESCLSIIAPSSEAKQVYIITFEPPISRISTLVSEDSSGAGTHWTNNLNRKITKITKGIFLPLQNPLRPPFPDKNHEIYRFFQTALTPRNFNKLNKFISSTTKRIIPVIFYFTRDSQQIYGMVSLIRKELSGSKKTICNGFKNYKIPAKIQMLSRFGNYDIQKTNINRVDSTRLQSRVGNENNILKDKKVTIIGCGSIGSRIALNLALNGIEKISLIDHDVFSFENIARHICSMNDIGSNKAEAVEKHIKRRIPHIEIIPHQDDCIEIINNTPDILKDNHIVISATGDKTFNLMLNESGISPATLYSWTELYGYASHSILVLPQSGGCLNCKLDHNLDFKFECVVSPKEKILRHEIGCGSVYLPFSSIDSDAAAGYASRLALCYLKGLIQKSTIWTFYGDLDEAIRQGLELATPTSNNFKLVRKQLSRRLGCKICRDSE